MAGRVCGIIITFLGVGMVAIPTGILSAGFVEQVSLIQNQDTGINTGRKKKSDKSKEKRHCPYCGEEL